MLTEKDIFEQSKSAFNLWDETWRKYSKINGKIHKRNGRSHRDLLFSGAGKTLLCIANSPSFEKQLQTIIKHKDNPAFEIACCDKCMSKLLDNGITPKYVHIADSGIDHVKYLEPYLEQTKNIILVSNINANIEWTQRWKGEIYFYVNKDNIESEKIYSEISGCCEYIPASSNVGNTLVVFSTQILGYDKYLLLGYDFGWYASDKYYAFEDSIKRHWMKHIEVIDWKGEFIYTSQNLMFSCKWLNDYMYNAYLQFGRINVFNCSDGILDICERVDLDKELSITKIRKLEESEKNLILNNRSKVESFDKTKSNLINEFIKNNNVVEILVRYIPKNVTKWLQY